MKRLLPFLSLTLGLLWPLAASAQQVKRVTRPLQRPQRRSHSRPFYPALQWRITLGMKAQTVPALADLDLDGTVDIVLPAANGNLYRLTSDGDVRWHVELPKPEDTETPSAPTDDGAVAALPNAEAPESADDGPTMAGVTVADVDRDGTLDILLAYGNTMFCFDAEGKTKWRFKLDAPIHSIPSVADLDGDGAPEVVFGARDNKLHVLDGAGREKWSFETKSWIEGGVAIDDLDGDGRKEIVFGSMDYNIYGLDSAGQMMWKYAANDWVQSSPCIADLDADGEKDIVVASDDGNLYCLSRRGTLKWKETLSGPQRLPIYLAVADLDHEGTIETIAALPDGTVSVYTAFGDRAWTTNVGAGVLGSPLVADFDRDGWQDILVATTGGQLVAMNTWGE